MRTIQAYCFSILVLFSALRVNAASPKSGGIDIRVGPTPAHHNLGDHGSPTTSWLGRSVTFPGPGAVALRAFADTQSSDRLELLVDGVVMSSMSGLGRIGPLATQVGAGTHVIRVQYDKDASVDQGLDTVWIDDVRMYSNDHLIELHSFSDAVVADPSGCSVPGWTRGGFGGGWCATYGPEPREMRRPVAMANAGYQPAPTTAGIVRTFTWPATGTNNQLAVKYFVDSEEDHDFFRILVDGAVRFQKSGRRILGTEVVSVPGGSHQVQLEYLKDESGDEGLDEARVLAVEIRTGGIAFQSGSPDGELPEQHPSGWTATSSDPELGWDVVRPRPPQITTLPDDVTRTIDGVLNKAEYAHAAILDLADRTKYTHADTKIRAVASKSGSLLMGIEIADDLATAFETGAQLTLLADAAVAADQTHTSCGAAGTLPGPNSRKLEVTWDSTGVATVTQQLGQCDAATPWKSAATPEQWPITVALQKYSDPTAYTIEVKIDAVRPAGVASNGSLALALRLDATTIGTFAAIPWRAQPVWNELDTSTWEEIWLGSTDVEPEPIMAGPIDAAPTP